MGIVFEPSVFDVESTKGPGNGEPGAGRLTSICEGASIGPESCKPTKKKEKKSTLSGIGKDACSVPLS